MKTVSLTLAALAATMFVGAAQAASCSTKQLEGVWVGAGEEKHPSYCLVQFNKTGQISHSSCIDPPAIKPSATLTGRLSVARDCGVTGGLVARNMRGKKFESKFTGTLDPDKGTIRGTVKVKGGPSVPYDFARHWR
jgi:hypothetical protein